MQKNCLITHVADADGAFPIILSKLVFQDIDVFSCEVSEVDETLKKVLERQSDYEKIYIVDINMSEEMASIIDNDIKLKEKIMVFDHHVSNLHLNKYSFIQVVDSTDERKECGTTLFYEYLKSICENHILYKQNLITMIELVREVDTYDFTDELKEIAFQFGSLYSIYGRERYIDHFYHSVLNYDVFSFSEIEKTLIEINEENTNRYIEEKMKRVKIAKILGVTVGIVFAEQNRSLLGHAMAEKLDIDIAIVINVDKSISYRADKENIDVAVLAKPYGGGGHKHAGGSPLPGDLQEKICEYIFKDMEWEK